jgi:hypothetical protein
LAVVCVSAATLAACGSSTKQFAATGFRPPEGSYKLIVVQPDVKVGLLNAGGSIEWREDWTASARANVLAALQAQQARRGGATRIAASRQDMGVPPALADELDRLHEAVGSSIQTHKYGELTLPTKKDKFDWTLGQAAIAFGQSSGFDYGLFLNVQDTFSTGGRQALLAMQFMGCAMGICAVSDSGRQTAFASLVDLKTGQVVWFNTQNSAYGDVRTPEGAEKLVNKLLDDMEPAKS